MVKKPAIIITSLGRTGTRFFAAFFGEIIPDSTSLHEPDTFHLGGIQVMKRLLGQIKEAGVYNMIIRKGLGQWSMPSVSHARVRGELGYAQAVQQVLSQRKKFVESRKGTVYIESSLASYGLIDVLKDVYQQHRVVYIIRDGRDFVRSRINRAPMYNRKKIFSLFAHRWPRASDFEDDPYCSEWATMSRFKRLCWAWAKLNEYALSTIDKNPDARLFRFEDIFKSEDRYQHLEDMVQFVTTFPDAKPFAVGSLDGWLDRRINPSAGLFPAWEEWSPEHKQQFETICGPLMKKSGYEFS
jgi:hypothetical protein